MSEERHIAYTRYYSHAENTKADAKTVPLKGLEAFGQTQWTIKKKYIYFLKLYAWTC